MLTFRVQKERKGFGHAVYQGRDFCENDPVLLLLGDTVYRSNSDKTCSLQLIEAFDELNKPMVSIHEIPVEQVSTYGVLSGTWNDTVKETQLNVSHFVEKPSPQYAKEFLSVHSKDGLKKYYAVFGQYILTPEVFNNIAENINAGKTEGVSGEYGLTEAVAACINTSGLTGVILDGTMYDMGNSEAYKNAMVCLS